MSDHPAEDRQPMQASGDGHAAAESEKEAGITREALRSGGQSEGGAYPNPHDAADPAPKGGAMGHGGQTEIGYHGPGQLGDEEVDPGRDNSSATRKG